MRGNFTSACGLRVTTLLAVVIVAAISSSAQTTPPHLPPGPTPSPSPPTKAAPSLERHFFADILKDQRAIWTAPFHMNRGDAKLTAPLGLVTAVLIATDRHTAGGVADGGSLGPVSRGFSQLGSYYATGSTAAAFYLVGRARGDARARETGLLGGEALVDSAIVVTALKTISQRPRPVVDNASGEFFDGGHSFPSGHAISAWSMATVIACEYGAHRPLVRIAAYGLATAVSLARFSGRKHFLSDVLVGSAIGYGIGRFVYKRHHDSALDDGAPRKTMRGCRPF